MTEQTELTPEERAVLEDIQTAPRWQPYPRMLQDYQQNWPSEGDWKDRRMTMNPKMFIYAMNPAGTIVQMSVRTDQGDPGNPEYRKRMGEDGGVYRAVKMRSKRNQGWLFVDDPEFAGDQVFSSSWAKKVVAGDVPEALKRHWEFCAREVIKRQAAHTAKQAEFAERFKTTHDKAIETNQEMVRTLNSALNSGTLSVKRKTNSSK